LGVASGGYGRVEMRSQPQAAALARRATTRRRRPARWLAAVLVATVAPVTATTIAAAGTRRKAVTYVGRVMQADIQGYVEPGVAFVVSASGRTITDFRTTRSPGPTMYTAACSQRPADQPCEVSGYAVGHTTRGLPPAVFPPPVIRVAVNGDFAGRITDGYARTTYVKGHLDKAHGTATGLISLSSISTPSNPISAVAATFTARAR
jgi:hypothetical protein